MGKFKIVIFRDISPQTNPERLFGIFAELLACGVFGYVMNALGQYFSSGDE
jgi:hypothetical protein